MGNQRFGVAFHPGAILKFFEHTGKQLLGLYWKLICCL